MKKFFNVFNKYFVMMLLIITSCVFVGNFAEANALNKSDCIIAEEGQLTPKKEVFKGSKLVNKFLLVNFKNESIDFTPYKDITSTLEQKFNTGDISVKKYYELNSNGKLDLTTDITKKDDSVFIATLDRPRTYYMPYLIMLEGLSSYEPTFNKDGYFDWYVVEKGPNFDEQHAPYYRDFFKENKLISKVYAIPEGVNFKEDADYTDKIMSYKAAQKLVFKNSNYALVNSPERTMREYQLYSNALNLSQQYMNTLNSNTIDSKYFDSFSIGLLNNKDVRKYNLNNNIYWNTLLWSHQISELGSTFNNINEVLIKPLGENLEEYIQYFVNFGFKEDDIRDIIGYIQNQPTVKGVTFNSASITNYDFSDISTEQHWKRFVENISTTCHELGHVLGLPDLYSYETGSADLVGSISHMSNSNVLYPSYFTSYEREKFGWLNHINIKTITSNGIYKVKAVKGDDKTNIVSYKIQNKKDLSQSVYLEYRNVDNKNFYDTRAANESGLVVYTTNNSVVNGNAQAGPYEIYINRQDGQSVGYSPIDVGQSLGNENTNDFSNAIYFQKSTNISDNVNSGIVVEVISRTEDELTFKVKASFLDNNREYTAQDFDNNNLLFTKLIGQSTIPGKLTADSFENMQMLDLSDCNIDNIRFLSYFNLVNIKYLNLIKNNFSTLDEVFSFATEKSLTTVLLSYNKIVLTSLPNSILTNPIFDLGIQLSSNQDLDIYVNNFVSFYYYFTPTSFTTNILVNSEPIDVCSNGIVKQYFSNTIGEIVVTQIFTNPVFGTDRVEQTFNNIKLTNKYTQENKLVMLVGDNLPTVENLISIQGISSSAFTYDYNAPHFDKIEDSAFDVKVKYNGVEVASLKVFYKVIEIIVDYKYTNPLILLPGEEFVDKGIIVSENKVKIPYQKSATNISDETPNASYYMEYFTGSVDYNGQLILGNSVSSIDTNKEGSYVVKYTLKTSNGKIYQNKFYLPIIIANNVLKAELFDKDLYSLLLAEKNSAYICQDDFSSLSYIDFSNKQLTSIQGLELLTFKPNVIIDLSCNNLANLSEVQTLVNNHLDIQKVILLFNNFEKRNVELFASRDKIILGVQNLDEVNFFSSNVMKVAQIYKDYDGYFNMLSSGYHITEDGAIGFSEPGQYYCLFDNTFGKKSYQKNIYILRILSRPDTVIEYTEVLNSNPTNFYDIKGISATDFTITSNFDTLVLNKIGTKNLITKFVYKDKEMIVGHKIIVKDTDAPVITFDGKLNVYVKNYEQYVSQYKNDMISANDPYEGLLEVSVDEPTMNKPGIYTIVYTATDSSGNTKKLTRQVTIGNVILTQTYGEENFDDLFSVPFEFETFSIDQFDITYKINNNEPSLEYSNKKKIKIYERAEYDLYFTFIHKENSELVYNFIYKVNIKDLKAPVILLNGNSIIDLKGGEEYTESGYKVEDNGTSDILTETTTSSYLTMVVTYKYRRSESEEYRVVDSLDTNQIGDYIILYTAKDGYNNSSVVERKVLIRYAEIQKIEIDEAKTLSRIGKDEKVTFVVKVVSDYITPPNPAVLWFVDGELFKETSGGKLEVSFDKVGKHVIKAKLATGDIFTQEYEVFIYAPSPYENIVLYVGLGMLGLIALCVIVSLISRYSKRNFY